MDEIVVNATPQMAPISDMRNRQNELLTMTESGPVMLLSRSKLAAILISPTQWDAIAHTLEEYRRLTNKKEQSSSKSFTAEEDMAADEGSGKKRSALAQIAALAQPYGPPDLARNFDKYMNRVSDDEPAN